MPGILSKMGRRRFAVGGVGLADPRITLNDPKTDAPATGGRTYNPLAEADYYTYGEGPEHQFFSGELKTPPIKPGSNLPTLQQPGMPGTQGAGGVGGVLGDLSQLAAAGKVAGQLGEAAGYDNALTQGLQHPVQGIKDLVGGSGSSGASAGTLGSLGGAGAVSGAGALGASTPIATDAALSNLGSVTAGEMFGTSGSLAAGAGPGSLGTSGGMSSVGAGGAGGAGAGSTLAASGITTALPLAAIGWAIADAFNASGDAKSAGTTGLMKGLMKSGQLTLKDPRTQTYVLPDGRWVRPGEKAREISEALRKGDNAAAQKAYEEWIGNAYSPGGDKSFKDWNKGNAQGGRPNFVTGGPGALAYAGDPKFNGSVRGKGTGRSDEIPARLSDGEYVMDAETVSMLGDGSTEAGSRKLDELRAKLRSHKGKVLAKGKFSPNAMDPLHYLGEE